MTALPKATIKSYFESGDRPTQTQFANLIDSYQDANSNLTLLASAGTGAVGLQLLAVATTAAAQSALALVPGVNVQAYGSTLGALGNYNTNGLMTQVSANVFTGRTINGTANQIAVSAGDGVAGNPTISLAFTETTFTPVLQGTSTAGTGTYTNQYGNYKRIGNIVFFQLYFLWSAHTGTGNMQIAGFPIAAASVPGGQALDINYYSNLATIGAGKKGIIEFPSGGGTTAQMYTCDPAGSAGFIAMDTAAEISITGFYFI